MIVSVQLEDDVIDLRTARFRAAFDKIHIGRAQAEKGRAVWIDGTLELATEMTNGRTEPNHQEFSRWLERHQLQKISKDDRTALLWMGKDLEAARAALEQTNSWSWLEIYRKRPREALRGPSKGPASDKSHKRYRSGSEKRKGPRIPDVMQEDNPPPERKGVVLKGLTREQVDPDFKGTSLQFRTKYGHVHLQTKQEIEHHKHQEELQAWLSAIGDHDRSAKAMLTAFSAVHQPTLQEWLSKPSKVEKLQAWYNSMQLACDALQQLLVNGGKP